MDDKILSRYFAIDFERTVKDGKVIEVGTPPDVSCWACVGE